MKLFGFGKEKKREVKSTTFPVRQFMLTGSGNAEYTKMSYTALAKEGYQANALAFTCIHKIKQAVASIDIFVEDEEGNVIKNHPALKLLERPNPLTTRKDFIGALTAFNLINGSSYAFNSNYDETLRPKEPKAIYTLMPSDVHVISGKALPKAYQLGDDTKLRFPVDQLTGSCAIMQIKDFDPLNVWYGQSRLQAAARAIDRFNAAEKWNYNLVKNGAKPSGVLTMKDPDYSMTTEQFREYAEAIKKEWEGESNAGAPKMLGNLDWKQMSLSPMDMDFKESQIMAARYIANCFGVPSQLLNIPESQTFSNYEQANLSFWQDTVIPIAEEIYSKLSIWLMPQFKDSEGLRFAIDLDKITALDVIRKEKAERYKGLVTSSIVLINEAREALDYEPIEGGNELLISGSMVKLSDVMDSELDDLMEDEDSQQGDEVEEDASN